MHDFKVRLSNVNWSKKSWWADAIAQQETRRVLSRDIYSSLTYRGESKTHNQIIPVQCHPQIWSVFLDRAYIRCIGPWCALIYFICQLKSNILMLLALLLVCYLLGSCVFSNLKYLKSIYLYLRCASGIEEIRHERGYCYPHIICNNFDHRT